MSLKGTAHSMSFMQMSLSCQYSLRCSWVIQIITPIPAPTQPQCSCILPSTAPCSTAVPYAVPTQQNTGFGGGGVRESAGRLGRSKGKGWRMCRGMYPMSCQCRSAILLCQWLQVQWLSVLQLVQQLIDASWASLLETDSSLRNYWARISSSVRIETRNDVSGWYVKLHFSFNKNPKFWQRLRERETGREYLMDPSVGLAWWTRLSLYVRTSSRKWLIYLLEIAQGNWGNRYSLYLDHKWHTNAFSI